jgi:hypothetical protein
LNECAAATCQDAAVSSFLGWNREYAAAAVRLAHIPVFSLRWAEAVKSRVRAVACKACLHCIAMRSLFMEFK